MPVSPARSTALSILLRVERDRAFSGELLHSESLEELSAADRGLATEMVMGVLRWRSRLDDQIAQASSRSLQKLDGEVLNALRLGVYQMLYLSRIPAHAAIHESVDLVKRARKSSAAPFVNAVLRKISLEPGPLPPTGSLAGDLAHPEWLVRRWVGQYGEARARAICGFDQQTPATVLRLDNDDVVRELQRDGIELSPGRLLADAHVVLRGDITHSKALADGRVFIQDEASQLVAALVGAGVRILDCCAAPGSKTAGMAARNPTAEIVAAELHAHRAELLRRRVSASNVRVVQGDVLALPISGNFDRVLADVPCSGTGTLARNPEIKWRLKTEDLGDLHLKQAAILKAGLQQLAPGGRLVYSTCSLEREENKEVVEEVLKSEPALRLLDARDELARLRTSGELVWNDLDSLLSGPFLRTIPGVHPCDGFFAAVITRRE